jgi:hypothetical protein
MPEEAPETLVHDLLEDSWVASNTYDFKPDIHYGWFDDDGGNPQLTIGQPEDSTVSGGDTGYQSINQSGEPGQEFAGTVDLNVWSRRSDMSGPSTGNPRQYNYQVTEEIRRIIRNNADQPVNPRTGNTPVEVVAWLSREPFQETERRKVVFRYLVTVGFNYRV